ncbi:hypothetical protein TYRP_004542 [Tyrophagus putrescentiae]|nr:hypothetical protein TYRP_004542 [Tyrophagus putrescentiae]
MSIGWSKAPSTTTTIAIAIILSLLLLRHPLRLSFGLLQAESASGLRATPITPKPAHSILMTASLSNKVKCF